MDNDERIKQWREERERSQSSGFRARGAMDASSDARDTTRSEDVLQQEILNRRRDRVRGVIRNLALYLIVPLVAVYLYVSLVATPLFRSEAVFTVQTVSQSAPSPTAGIFSVGSAGSTIADAFKAREYILSRPMMEILERRVGFLSHFAGHEMDPLTRFGGPFGINDDAFEYFRKRVRVTVDVQEGILRVAVHARTRADAERFARAILEASERHVNALSQKISDDQIESLSQNVRDAELQLQRSRRSLAMVQSRRGELSPEQTASALYQLLSNLQIQLAEAQRQRDSLLSQGLTNSPLLPPLNAQIKELESQIANQRRKLVSPSGGSLQRALGDIESAAADKEIAETRHKSALNTLEQAYLRVLEQNRYFIIIVPPAASSRAAVRDILTIFWPVAALVLAAYALAFLLLYLGRKRGASFSLTRSINRWRQ